jgi:integrase
LADYVSILRTFLRYLHGEGHIASTLWIGLEAPRIWQETTAPQHFSWEEVGQLIERVQSDPQSEQRDVALVWLLASAGLRPCEAARMKIADIDWNDATVIVRLRKRNKPLLLPLLPAVVDALQAYIDTERPDNAEHDEVFLNDDGLPCKSGSELSFRVQVLAWKVGLGWGRSGYALRRGLGVRLLESGAGLGQIGLMLGHDDPRSTRVYLRASMNQLKDVADNYANLL